MSSCRPVVEPHLLEAPTSATRGWKRNQRRVTLRKACDQRLDAALFIIDAQFSSIRSALRAGQPAEHCYDRNVLLAHRSSVSNEAIVEYWGSQDGSCDVSVLLQQLAVSNEGWNNASSAVVHSTAACEGTRNDETSGMQSQPGAFTNPCMPASLLRKQCSAALIIQAGWRLKRKRALKAVAISTGGMSSKGAEAGAHLEAAGNGPNAGTSATQCGGKNMDTRSAVVQSTAEVMQCGTSSNASSSVVAQTVFDAYEFVFVINDFSLYVDSLLESHNIKVPIGSKACRRKVEEIVMNMSSTELQETYEPDIILAQLREYVDGINNGLKDGCDSELLFDGFDAAAWLLALREAKQGIPCRSIADTGTERPQNENKHQIITPTTTPAWTGLCVAKRASSVVCTRTSRSNRHGGTSSVVSSGRHGKKKRRSDGASLALSRDANGRHKPT